jgi:endonuclease YncB( thermonuclease family)
MSQSVWGPLPAAVLPAERHSSRDGDTFPALVDLGCNIFYRASIRIVGINARELHEPGGEEARAHFLELLPEGAKVSLMSVRYDKFGGRLDCTVNVPGIGDLATRLVADGYAAVWDGTGSRPVPPWPLP